MYIIGTYFYMVINTFSITSYLIYFIPFFLMTQFDLLFFSHVSHPVGNGDVINITIYPSTTTTTVLEDQLKSGPEMTRIEHLSDLHYPDADPPCHFCSNQSSLSIHDSNRLKIVSGGTYDCIYSFCLIQRFIFYMSAHHIVYV